jgi:hypothetical protein
VNCKLSHSLLVPFLACCLLSTSRPLQAQTYYTPTQLDQLLQPLALYPDPLLAQILPACAFPQEIDDVNNHNAGDDPSAWDPPVQAVAHYPDVLSMLDQNLAWTSAVGQAYANQGQDVMASIQRLRMLASRSGNLVSGPQEEVDVQGNYITITPTNPGEIYVPSYDPSAVYQPAPYGYPRPGISFSVGFGTGAWLSFGLDWMGGCVVPYPAGVYWGAGPWSQWARGGGYSNVSYFHNTFNGNNQSFYRLNHQRVVQNQLTPGRYNQARLNEYRGNVPRANPGLPQFRGAANTNFNRSGSTVNPYLNRFPQRPAQQQAPARAIQVPASVVHGPQNVFNIQPQPQVRAYQQRGEASLRSQPNVTGIQQAPRQFQFAPQPQRSSSRPSQPQRQKKDH